MDLLHIRSMRHQKMSWLNMYPRYPHKLKVTMLLERHRKAEVAQKLNRRGQNNGMKRSAACRYK